MERGQEILVKDLEKLLDETKAGEFGEFSNRKYAAPKMELASRLYILRQDVINGKYDEV